MLAPAAPALNRDETLELPASAVFGPRTVPDSRQGPRLRGAPSASSWRRRVPRLTTGGQYGQLPEGVPHHPFGLRSRRNGRRETPKHDRVSRLPDRAPPSGSPERCWLPDRRRHAYCAVSPRRTLNGPSFEPALAIPRLTTYAATMPAKSAHARSSSNRSDTYPAITTVAAASSVSKNSLVMIPGRASV